MTDTGPAKPASPVRKKAQSAALAGINIIWFVPIIALVVTVGIAWNSFIDRGALIEVEFTDATGVTPGETTLRFREVTVGQVEKVSFTTDLSRVIVGIRVDKDVAPYIDDQSAFWIVRPQVTAQGVTRLDTVLSGSFIEGYWDSEVTVLQDHFVGLDRAPLVREDTPGRMITLSMPDAGGLSEGAPVLFHGLSVGRVENLRLDDERNRVLADAFIEAPHDTRITSSTAFWDTSGFSLSLGAQGLSFNVNSLSSVLQGGVAFDTLVSGGTPIESGHVFILQENEATARNAIFTGDESNTLLVSMLIDESLQGLSRGADVQFQGLRVGQVTDLSLDMRRTPQGEGPPGQVQQRVTMSISPRRLGLPEGSTADDALAFLQDAVGSGLRARVASAGFLGTSLMVEMVDVADDGDAQIDTTATPYPIIPSAKGDLEDFSASAQGLLSRVGQLPIEEVLQSAADMMNSITALASSQDTRAIPQSLRLGIEDAQKTLAEIRGMVQQLRETGAAESAGTALAQAGELTAKLNEAADKLPQMLESIRVAAGNVEGVDFNAIGVQIDGALQDLRSIIGTAEAQGLPARLSMLVATLDSTADSIDTLAGDLQASGAAANMGRLVDQAAQAAEAVRLAAADVPDMVDQIDSAAAAVEKFDFAGISTQAEGILADLRAVLGSKDAEQLPRNLSDTLQAASGLLNDLRDGNAAGSLNNALNSASAAADQIAQSVQELPRLLQRLQQTAARADAVLAAYGDRSSFNNEATNMLREVRRATEAFGSLARLIERNPRAFILGR